MHALDRSAWEAMRADSARIASLWDSFQSATKTGLCQTCGAALQRDEMPGVMVVSYTCEHGPVSAPEFTPSLTPAQRNRLRLPVSA